MALLVEKSIPSNFCQKNLCSKEDRYIYDDENCIYAVFDGHSGNIVSDELSKNMTRILLSKLNKESNDTIEKSILEAFQEIDSQVIEKIGDNPNCGSTCALSIKIGNKLVMVNLGDSDIILYKDGSIHKKLDKHICSNLTQREEIESNPYIEIKPGWTPRVLSDTNITMIKSDFIKLRSSSETIVPTKNFGHKNWKLSNNMDVIPFIEIIDLQEGSGYELVITSDGVSDVLINTDEIYEIISSEKEGTESEKLVNFAEKRWLQKWKYIFDGKVVGNNENIGIDDITAIYRKFKI